MILYDYCRSSAAYRVRIALNLKKLEYQQVSVNLLNAEQISEKHRTRNPQGLVPVLKDKGIYLSQSLAMCEYLDEAYPETPLLLPDSPEQKVRVRSLSQLIACDIHPINNLRVLTYLQKKLIVDDEEKTAWYQHWIIEGFTALESLLKDSKETGRYCHGDTPTLADVCLVPQVFNARRFKVEMEAYPTILRIDDALTSLEAVAKAHPSIQPDA